MTEFRTEVFQNEYLPRDGTDVHAIISIAASGAPADQAPTAPAEVIVVDASGSMGRNDKMPAVKQATGVALDALRDGTRFAVVAGTQRASCIYPRPKGLAVASPRTRDEARRAVGRLRASGGTAIGSWLDLADQLLGAAPDAIRHALLLTDGWNEHERPGALEAALDRCRGRFQCDCRGVGSDWQVDELRLIASSLLGTVDIIREPADMAADFAAVMQASMAKRTDDVALRVWTPRSAEILVVEQVAPTVEDLVSHARVVDDLRHEFPTGAWGDERREYHLAVRVPAGAVGDEMLAARVGIAAGGTDVAESAAKVRAVWTDDTALSTRINAEVAHYTGQVELASAIQEGIEAKAAGDEVRATAKLGRAVQLATASGNDDTVRLLEAVVDVQDANTGTVVLKQDVGPLEEMTLDARSTVTKRHDVVSP